MYAVQPTLRLFLLCCLWLFCCRCCPWLASPPDEVCVLGVRQAYTGCGVGGLIFYEVDFAYFRLVDQAVDQWLLMGGKWAGCDGKCRGTMLLGCSS